MKDIFKFVLRVYLKLSPDKHKAVKQLSIIGYLSLVVFAGYLGMNGAASYIVWDKSDVEIEVYAVFISSVVGIIVAGVTYNWCSKIEPKIKKNILMILEEIEKELEP